ncbi:nucleoside-diphosphate-sugar epimerase [[Clostridium] cellulosi]|uniref:Nucleoside-diphosphate-sugar epimerase n=1 Tax=[Clostridium] cellulosi TaxID=29343 RepID=A0A078KV91_9FIRM|nr:nucleoside-diphosphate-sugar epimerase [[Clostridium] cellulosi]
MPAGRRPCETVRGVVMDRIIKEDCLEYLKKIDLSPLKGKTVFITGANGLIGTYIIYMLHLANLTQDAGINIVATSRNAPCSKLSDIFSGRYTFISADLAKDGVPELPFKTDYIIHGATYAQPATFIKKYRETILLNTAVTESLLKKAKDDGASFLFLSSSEVYGNPDKAHIPTPEDYPGLCTPVSVRAVYSEAKRLGETICFCYRNFEDLDVKIARISMTYGPGVTINDKRVLGEFMRQALFDHKIKMIDDGRKERPFCYIADSVIMLLNILLYGKDFVYNVGINERISIRQLAEEICRQTGSSLEIEQRKTPTGRNIEESPECVQLDVSKACSEFGITSFKPFSEGLKRTIEWNMLNLK